MSAARRHFCVHRQPWAHPSPSQHCRFYLNITKNIDVCIFPLLGYLQTICKTIPLSRPTFWVQGEAVGHAGKDLPHSSPHLHAHFLPACRLTFQEFNSGGYYFKTWELKGPQTRKTRFYEGLAQTSYAPHCLFCMSKAGAQLGMVSRAGSPVPSPSLPRPMSTAQPGSHLHDECSGPLWEQPGGGSLRLSELGTLLI